MSFSLSTFYSNHVEQLYAYLKQALYSADTQPFTQRLVAVASPALKNWLMLRLAKDPEVGIATGLEIGTLDDLIQKLRLGFSIKSYGKKKIPTLTELGLAIEVELRRIILCWQAMNEPQQKLYAPLVHYFQIEKQGCLSKKSEKRLLGLALELAELFLQYGKYGYSMVSEWLTEPESETHWQKHLWRRLFASESTWTFLSKELLEQGGFIPSTNLQVNLFSIGYLPPVYHRYLEKISARHPVNYYVLSPCQHFWSDILSDKEANRMIKTWHLKGGQEAQLEALEDFLRDRNPLLANFGRIGREMAQLVENSSSSLHEHYFAPQAALKYHLMDGVIPHHTECFAGGKLTLLQGIQTDMLVLRNPQDTPKVNLDYWDKSVQIHSSSSKYREVQALYNTLMSLIHEHAGDLDPITPGDIIVMAPDINEYAPYIRSIFESRESSMAVQIMDLQVPAQNPSLQAFLHLISLSASRWDASSVLRMLDFPVFRKKNKLEKEDVYEIKEWIQKAEIRWGNDALHREALIANDHGGEAFSEQSSVGTWDFGIHRLLSGLVYTENLDPSLSLDVDPLPVENSKAELLSTFIKLLKLLRCDLQPLSDRREMSIREWTECLKNLYEKYLDLSGDEEGMLIIEDIFSTLGSSSKYFINHKFPFTSIKRHMDGLLNAKKTTYRDARLNAVKFCSLLPMRTIPTKIIVLLGLQEGAYPRREINKSLNLLLKHPKADYRPSQTDFDRYLFLEALLSARQYFIMSYLCFTEDDFKEQSPSLVVLELLDYLDKAYQVQGAAPSKICVYKHPFFSFDKEYFSANGLLKSYSKTDYALAASYYQPQKQPQFQFIPSFDSLGATHLSPLESSSSPKKQMYISVGLKELNAFAKNPLKTYLNKKLGIYLPKEEGKVLDIEEPLLLSNLKIDDLKKKSLKKSLEEVAAYANHKGYLAPGIYREVALKDLEDKITQLHDNLKLANITPRELFDIEFGDDYAFPQLRDSGNWGLPPLILQGKSERQVKITGRIKGASPQGLLEHAEDKDDVAKFWPRFLIFHALVHQHQLPIEPQVIFAKTGGIKKPFFECSDNYLLHYLDYYFSALDRPSPLIPEWVPLFIKEEKSSLKDKLNETMQDAERFYNEYALWMFKHNSLPEDIFEWKPIAQSLFGEALENWFLPTKRD